MKTDFPFMSTHTADPLFVAAVAARLAVIRNGKTWPVSALDLAKIAVAAYGAASETERVHLKKSHAALVTALETILEYTEDDDEIDGETLRARIDSIRAVLKLNR